MVSWVPFSPSSCSTRGRPFPSGAFTAGLNAGEFLGAVRCWSPGGTEYLVGSIKRGRSGLVCSVNHQGRAEHHHEFWTLVAGDELVWRECSDTDSLDNLHNKVNIAGSDSSEGAIGLYEDMVGTVNRCQVRWRTRSRLETVRLFMFSVCTPWRGRSAPPSSCPAGSRSSPTAARPV